VTIALALVRTLVGLLFVASGAAKLFDHAQASADFARWGVPSPDISVLLVAALEIICGGLFALGALTRPVGLLLATLCVGAAIFAGRVDHAYWIGMPILFLSTVFFAWRSGRPAPKPLRRPGVQ